jgi:AraC-like DNA-binding protein
MSLTDSNVAPASVDVATIPTGYAIAPNTVMRDASLSTDARLLYVLVDSRLGKKRTQKIRLATLAADLGKSERTVRRIITELEQAGLIRTHRTGMALIFGRDNPSRRRDTRVHSDRTPVSTPKRSKSLELSTTAGQVSNPETPPQIHCDSAAEYLTEIRKATRVRLTDNATVRTHIAEIAGRGTSPIEAATMTAAYLAAHREKVHNPGGFIVTCILPAIAAGELAEQTPAVNRPLTYLERVAAEPCRHGDPLGEQGCALCRHAKQGATA